MYHFTRHFIPIMLAQERGGVIINIASLVSNVNWKGVPSCFVYTATLKGAMYDRAHESSGDRFCSSRNSGPCRHLPGYSRHHFSEGTNQQHTRGLFLESPGNNSDPKSHSKVDLDITITELFSGITELFSRFIFS